MVGPFYFLYGVLYCIEIENSNSNLSFSLLQDLEKMFEIIVDSHAVVKNYNRENLCPLYPVSSHGNILQNYSKYHNQVDIDHHEEPSLCPFIATPTSHMP